ncbi:DUF4843 domain-containing protein [Pedobacter hiemivivus]|nr:DUF4843 domain-containing protein [Pedobacter hiemivivus]
MKNIVLILLLFFIVSCKKSELTAYEAGSGLAFYIVSASERDSMNYSFASQLTIKSRDTIFLKLRLTGKPVSRAREISISTGEGTTAKEGVHFILPKILLPSDSLTISYPVILLNAMDLTTNTYKLVLKVQENKDFVQGAVGISNVETRNIPYYKINFNNQLIKPDYWIYVQNYFGDYSNVKFRFIIEYLGFTDLRPTHIGGTIIYSDFLNYNVALKNELEKYKAIYGPLMDENVKEVSFP